MLASNGHVNTDQAVVDAKPDVWGNFYEKVNEI